MSLSKRNLQQAQRDQREIRAEQAEEAAEGPQTLDPAIVKDPVKFCQVYLKFNPTPYQEKLLLDESKRIYVCWSRQSTTLAARMIQRCMLFPGTLNTSSGNLKATQLDGLRYRVSRQGSVLFESSEKERLHDDYLWALALAVHSAARGALFHGHSTLLR